MKPLTQQDVKKHQYYSGEYIELSRLREAVEGLKEEFDNELEQLEQSTQTKSVKHNVRVGLRMGRLLISEAFGKVLEEQK